MSYVAAVLMVLLAGQVGGRARAARDLWLVVGASSSSPAAIARAAKDLADKGLAGLVFQGKDCGERRTVFGVAVEIVGSADAAKVGLERARRTVKHAYTKRCPVVPRSLLAHGFPAVDPSIADVPSDTVNWQDSDRVSSVIELADGRGLIASRVFVRDADDPLEGRRVRVILPDDPGKGPGKAKGPGKGKVLAEDCTWPEQFHERGGVLAFQCAGEQAGDQLLHTVLVFDASGHALAKVERCRNPVLPGDHGVTCQAESVDAQGRLKLRSKRVRFADRTAHPRGSGRRQGVHPGKPGKR